MCKNRLECFSLVTKLQLGNAPCKKVRRRFTMLISRILLFCLILWVPATAALAATQAADNRGVALRPVAPTGEKVKGEQWLLTIGIDSYLSWPRLKTAVNDAKSLKSILLERYNIDKGHVIELYDENATRKNIIGALRD